jgi:hypothetical protein
MGSHVGTGYKSNYRPLVSYQPHLDALDSPAMGYGLYNLLPPPFLPCWASVLRQLQPPRTGMLSLEGRRPGVLGGSGCAAQLGGPKARGHLRSLGEGEGGGKFLGTSNEAPQDKTGGLECPSSRSVFLCTPLLPHPCHFREQLRDNFQTVTSQSYCPLEVPDGKGPLPWNMYQTSSAYGREKPNTVPLTKEVSVKPGLGQGSPRVGGKAGSLE